MKNIRYWQILKFVKLARIATAGQRREGRVDGWWFILRSNIKKINLEILEDIDQNNVVLARIASAG